MVKSLLVIFTLTLQLQNSWGFAEETRHIPDLRIGTDGGFPPFTFINDKGQIDGFETALIKRACRLSNLKCQIIYNHITFPELLPGVESGRWDMTYGGFGITDDRLVKFDFVTTYQSNKFFFGPKSFKLDTYPQDLAGVTIGAEAGTKFVEHLQALSEFLVSEGLSPITIVELPGIEEIEAALLDDTIALTPTGEEVINVLKGKAGFEDFDSRGPEIISSFLGSVFGRGDGLVFRKGDRARYLFEKSMQHMFYNCDYARIEKKYLSTVNALTPQHCRD